MSVTANSTSSQVNRAILSLFVILGLAVITACSPADQTATVVVPAPVTAPVYTPGDLEFATPESVGMDSDRLARVRQRMQEFVDAGRLAGVVTMAARDGKIIHSEAVGYRDIDSGDPMEVTDIFRIYSMTKPVTGVAMMMLYEEGKFRLSDPVEKYIPEFTDLQVFAEQGPDGNMITEPQDHKMTIRELMSHTGGLSYGIFSQSEVDEMYVAANILDPGSTLQDMIDKLSAIPLRQQPGSTWHYSVSVDVQGYLVEKLSGQKFGDFLEERIFQPLGMTDTDFYVPAEKVNRFAQVYRYNPDSSLVAGEGFADANYLVNPNLQSGGGGLVSTARDYLAFSQMLLNGGELNGVRLLAPLTVELMHRNQMPEDMPVNVLGAGGTSFGLDFAIVENPVAAESYSKGEYYWGGAAGTWFWVDPVEDIVFVGMIQQFGANGHQVPNVRGVSRTALYQAIMEPN